MSQNQSNLDMQLSQRIKTERTSRDWSLTDLTERSGVSRAMINKIERGESSPTASLLGKLSGAFGISLSTLLARAENNHKGHLIRAAEQPIWIDPETAYVRTQITSLQDAETPLDITKVMLPAQQQIAYSAASFTHKCQIIWVYEGCLTFKEGNVEHQLNQGDTLQLGQPQDRVFKNNSAQDCAYIVTVLRNPILGESI